VHIVGCYNKNILLNTHKTQLHFNLIYFFVCNT